MRIGSPKEIWDRRGLPGWTYFSDELFSLERDLIFKTHWQCVCHVNDIPTPGCFTTFDLAGERALIVRGNDQKIRSFHNLCRHRGSRVVAASSGKNLTSISCPFHGWTYNLDGSLRGVARPHEFPELNNSDWGLKPVEMEIWHGFVFVRFCPGPQGSVASVLKRIEPEAACYQLKELLPVESDAASETIDANWKSVRDVDNEGYHVAQAHPGLHDLFGKGYFDEPYSDGVARSVGPFNTKAARSWSVRHYKNILPEANWLPESHRRLWLYVGVFPNLVFGFYPDSVIFYQEIPVTATRTLQRSAVYRRPSESRELRLARYLSGRIDRHAVAEDRLLTVWSTEATQSSAFDHILLSDLEYGVWSFHEHLRNLLPVLGNEHEPASGTVAALNASILSRTAH